jgi:hypothetical protein
MAGKKNNNFHYSIFWKFWKYDQNRLFISFQTFTIFKTRIRMMPTEVRINFRRHLKSANWLVHRHRVEPLKFETSNLGQRNKGLCFAPDVAKLATFYAKVDLLMTPDQFFSRECKKYDFQLILSSAVATPMTLFFVEFILTKLIRCLFGFSSVVLVTYFTSFSWHIDHSYLTATVLNLFFNQQNCYGSDLQL